MRRAATHLRPRAPIPSSSTSPSPAFLRPRPSSARSPLRPFSDSASRLAEGKEGDKKDQGEQKQKQKEEEPDSTVAGRSPFAAFVDAIREEVRKNREWQDSVKQLGGEVDKVQDSEAMRKAKEAYERARVSKQVVLAGLRRLES